MFLVANFTVRTITLLYYKFTNMKKQFNSWPITDITSGTMEAKSSYLSIQIEDFGNFYNSF